MHILKAVKKIILKKEVFPPNFPEFKDENNLSVLNRNIDRKIIFITFLHVFYEADTCNYFPILLYMNIKYKMHVIFNNVNAKLFFKITSQIAFTVYVNEHHLISTDFQC